MSKGFSGNPGSGSFKRIKNSKRNEQRKLERMRTLPGYPIEKVFQTKEEIDNYFKGDRITCLFCGKSYKSLNAHLKVHGFTEETYKEKYGLPYHRGLCGEATKKLHSIHFKKLVKDGIIGAPSEEILKKMREGVKKQRFQPFRKNVAIQNAMKTFLIPKKNLKFNREKGKYEYFTDEDFNKILELSISENSHPMDTIKKYKNSLPRLTQLRNKIRESNDYKKRYYEIINNLPFEIQAKHQMLGKRFIEELKRLKSLSYSNEKIAEMLKVHEVTIEKYTFKNKIFKPEKISCKNGHPYENEKKKCNICATINKRKITGALPREIAKNTLVNKQCWNCNINIIAKKIGRQLCIPCRTEKY